MNNGASHAHYTQGLVLATSDTYDSNCVVKQDLHRNRALVRLTLGYYEGAIADAIAALTHESDDEHMKLDAKAYFRAASASYKLKQFNRSNEFLQALLELTPTDKQALILLKRNKRRLREHERGEYDISDIKNRLSTNPLVDAAEYHINTTTGSSTPGHGRGLLATRDLEPGDLVMAETAFCYLSGNEDSVVFECNSHNPDDFRIGRAGLWSSVTKKLMSNPVLGDEFLQLHCTMEGHAIHVDRIDGLPVVDTFQIHDMVTTNVFGVPADKEDRFAGIWIRSAYINHSCIPNAERDVVGDMMMVRATRSIRKGEEILMSYLGFDRDDTRTQNFERNWGFQCDCLQCLTDAKCSDASLKERARLSARFNDQHKSKDPEEILKRNMFDTLEQNVKDIAATYDSALYSNLPRTALIPVQILLLRAYIAAGSFVKASRTAAELLRTLGFEVDTQGDGILAIRETANSFIPRDAVGLRGIISNHAVHALDAGLFHAAQELLRFARTLELIICGTSGDTFEFWNEAIKPENSLARMMRRMSHAEQAE